MSWWAVRSAEPVALTSGLHLNAPNIAQSRVAKRPRGRSCVATSVSSATRLFSPAEPADLLEISRDDNERDAIARMLLNRDGKFMQLSIGHGRASQRLLSSKGGRR